MTKQAILEDIVAYFESKTKPILERYGPGPRVHYHTGLIDDSPPKDASIPSGAGHWSAGRSSCFGTRPRSGTRPTF